MKRDARIQIVLNCIVLATGVLTFFCWYFYLDIEPLSDAVWVSFYKTIKTFFLGAVFDIHPIPHLLKAVSLLAPLSLASSLVFKMIKQARLRFSGFFIGLFYRNHIVIAGNPEFCRALISRGEKVDRKIVVLLPEENEQEQELFRSSRVHTVCSNMHKSRTWKWVGLLHADNLILSPGYFDFLDEIKGALKPILEKRKSRNKSPLMVNYALSTRKQKEIFSDSRTWFDDINMDAHSFQFENLAACSVASLYAPHRFLDSGVLEREAPSLLVDGFNEFCGWFLLETAQLYHYPSFRKLKITLITDNSQELRGFLADYPGLDKVIDLKVYPRSEIRSRIHFAEEDLFMKEGRAPHLVFCFPDDPWNIPADARMWRRYLTLVQKTSTPATRPSTEPLIFFIPKQCKTPDTFKAFASEWKQLSFTVHAPEDFLTLDQIIENRIVIDNIAMALHEVYSRKYNSGRNWTVLSDREKDQNRRSARHLILKLNMLGYELSDDPEAEEVSLKEFPAEKRDLYSRLEHLRWSAEKLLDNFIPGPFPDNKELKNLYKESFRIHQDIRPFEELTKEDISKDEETFKDIKELLKRVAKTHKLTVFKPS